MADIIKYLPAIKQDLEYYINITNAENPEFDKLSGLMTKWKNNNYPKLSDEDGLEVFEKVFNIKRVPTDTIEDRRVKVLARLNERLPYTEIRLRRMLSAICGWDGFELEIEDLILTVYLAMQNNSQIGAVYDLLNRVVPMNVLLRITQLIKCYCGLNFGAISESFVNVTIAPFQEREYVIYRDEYLGQADQFKLTLSILPYR